MFLTQHTTWINELILFKQAYQQQSPITKNYNKDDIKIKVPKLKIVNKPNCEPKL